MPIRSDDPATIASPGQGEVRPEELSELVERLHRQQERLSVGDVAETLGVAPEAVEATLRAMRSERIPPIVTTMNLRRRRRFRREGIVAGAILLGTILFAIGHEAGMARGQGIIGVDASTMTQVSPNEDLSQRLRAALPAGATLTVGDVSYTGAPGSVFAGESALTPLIKELMDREANEGRNGFDGKKASAEVIARITNGADSASDSGLVAWKTFKVSLGGDSFAGKWPRQMQSPQGDPRLNQAIVGTRYQAAVQAANRLIEWAAKADER